MKKRRQTWSSCLLLFQRTQDCKASGLKGVGKQNGRGKEKWGNGKRTTSTITTLGKSGGNRGNTPLLERAVVNQPTPAIYPDLTGSLEIKPFRVRVLSKSVV